MTGAERLDPPAVGPAEDRRRTESGAVRIASARALLALLAPGARPSLDAHQPIDWDWIIERARAHKVGALLAARLQDAPLRGHLTAEQNERLSGFRRNAAETVQAAQATLVEIDRRLRGRALAYLLTKGLVLSRLVYPEADLRNFADLDVVVRREDVPAAVDVLQSLGYRQGQVWQTLGRKPQGEREWAEARRVTRRFYERFDHEIPFVAPSRSGLLPVDLHWDIAPRRRLAVDGGSLWGEARRVCLAGVDVETLSAEATLIHLAIHATTCTFAGFRLLHLCDVAWALDRLAPQADRLWGLARRWRIERQLAVVLEMTARLFAVSPPPGGPRLPARRAAPFGVIDESFLLAEPPPRWHRRLYREARWGAAMGCLAHNLARNAAVRRTRLLWRLGRVVRPMRPAAD